MSGPGACPEHGPPWRGPPLHLSLEALARQGQGLNLCPSCGSCYAARATDPAVAGRLWGGEAGGAGGRGRAAPVLVREGPLTVLALEGPPVAGPAAQALGLELLGQARVEGGPHWATCILLVPPQVQLGWEELVTHFTAKRGLLCKRENSQEVGGGALALAPGPAGGEGVAVTRGACPTLDGPPPVSFLPSSQAQEWLPWGPGGCGDPGPSGTGTLSGTPTPRPLRGPPVLGSREGSQAKCFVYELGEER